MLQASLLIRKARLNAGVTQAELASHLGTTQSAVARLEAPGSNPRLATLTRALSALGQHLHAEVRPRPELDETMIAANLRLLPLHRLRAFSSAYSSVAGIARAAQAGRS